MSIPSFPGADPRVLEKGFVCIKLLWFALLILSHFHWIFKNRDWELEPPVLPLDLPLFSSYCIKVKKKGDKDQEMIQSSTTLDPGYHMGK